MGDARYVDAPSVGINRYVVIAAVAAGRNLSDHVIL
jgi:hypothetical protein